MTEEQIQKIKETWESALDGVFVQPKGIKQVLDVISELSTLQQQNKQLIEAIDRASDLLSHNHNAYHYLQDALQQIQGNKT